MSNDKQGEVFESSRDDTTALFGRKTLGHDPSGVRFENIVDEDGKPPATVHEKSAAYFKSKRSGEELHTIVEASSSGKEASRGVVATHPDGNHSGELQGITDTDASSKKKQWKTKPLLQVLLEKYFVRDQDSNTEPSGLLRSEVKSHVKTMEWDYKLPSEKEQAMTGGLTEDEHPWSVIESHRQRAPYVNTEEACQAQLELQDSKFLGGVPETSGNVVHPGMARKHSKDRIDTSDRDIETGTKGPSYKDQTTGPPEPSLGKADQHVQVQHYQSRNIINHPSNDSDRNLPSLQGDAEWSNKPQQSQSNEARARRPGHGALREMEVNPPVALAMAPSPKKDENTFSLQGTPKKYLLWLLITLALLAILGGTFGGVFAGKSSDPQSATETKVFKDTDELYAAVDKYMVNKTLTVEYGASINDWDVSKILVFDYLFDSKRKKGNVLNNIRGYLFNEDLSRWNTSSAVSMVAMFSGAREFNGDVSQWDLNRVTNTSFMFHDASAFNQDLSSWNVSSVKDVTGMFLGALSFNWPLSSWDLSQVTDASFMFANATSFNQPVLSWNVTSVTDMRWMFANATAFNQPVLSWNVGSVRNMSSMFYLASSFNQYLSSWDVSSVTDMSVMFEGASAFNQPLTHWNVSLVTTLYAMFVDAVVFNQPLGYWNVRSVTTMKEMFWNAAAFNQPLSDWNVSSVDNMHAMFYDAIAFNQPLFNWNLSSVVDMSWMLAGAQSFNQDLSSWDVGSATNMEFLFYNMNAFNGNVSNWNTSLVSNMYCTFHWALAFNQDISSWDVSSVTSAGSMFEYATSFNQDLSNWNVSSASDLSYMFYYAQAFNQSLCDWLMLLQSNVDVTEMFLNTSCLDKTEPTLPSGPMCHVCG